MAEITERTVEKLRSMGLAVHLSGGQFGGELALVEDFIDGAEKTELHITHNAKQYRYRYDPKTDKTHAVFIGEIDV